MMDIQTNLLKMGTAGLVSYPIYNYFYSGDVLNTNLFGRISLPLALAIGASVAFTTSEMLHQYVMPHTHEAERFGTPATALVNVGLNYGMENVALGLMNSSAVGEINQMNLLASSAGSVILAQYVYNNFVAPFYGISSHAGGSYY